MSAAKLLHTAGKRFAGFAAAMTVNTLLCAWCTIRSGSHSHCAWQHNSADVITVHAKQHVALQSVCCSPKPSVVQLTAMIMHLQFDYGNCGERRTSQRLAVMHVLAHPMAQCAIAAKHAANVWF
jgi:hypothetical protein